jgi:hypothetical protein
LFVNVYVNQHATEVEDGVATKFTSPEKPLTLPTSITVCLSDKIGIAWEVGVSVIVKLATVMLRLRVIEWDKLPLTAFNVIV